MIRMCDECGGSGMFDVLSSIPCVCRMKKNIQNTLNRIVRLKEKAVKEQRWEHTKALRVIEKKLIKKLKK